MQRKLFQSPNKKIQANRYHEEKHSFNYSAALPKRIQKDSTKNQDYKKKQSSRTHGSLRKDYETSKTIDMADLNLSKYSMYEALKTLKIQKRQNQIGKNSELKLPDIYFKNKSNINGKNGNQFRDQHQKKKIENKIDQSQQNSTSKGVKTQKKNRNQYKISIRSKAGLNGSIMKINQDLEIVQQRLPYNLKLFCICDGHGNNGHHVVAFIKKRLLQNVRKILKELQNFSYFEQQIYFAFLKINEELLQSGINTQLSGSTITAIFIYQGQIICFNIGDSRAILLNLQYDRWKAQQISKDHKPDRQDQAKRIIENGGRIQHLKGQRFQGLGPLRVWMKQIQSPGLAMTRCLGNKAGIKAGIIGEPQVTQFTIKPENKYLLVATDAVWQHLQNNEIAKLLSNQLNQEQMQAAADKLLKKVCEQWENKFNKRDDITFILVKVNSVNEPMKKIE